MVKRAQPSLLVAITSTFSRRLGTLRGLPTLSGRKAGTTSSPHGPYVLGYTRVTMARTTGGQAARWSKSLKARPSPDRGLQFNLVKLESLVMAHQQRRREYVPGPCTHRPSSAESGGHPKLDVGQVTVNFMIGAKS